MRVLLVIAAIAATGVCEDILGVMEVHGACAEPWVWGIA